VLRAVLAKADTPKLLLRKAVRLWRKVFSSFNEGLVLVTWV
jgi:hypothetical protein